MIYATIHTYNTNQQCIISNSTNDDLSWQSYDVPDMNWLYINNGVILVHTDNPYLPQLKLDKKTEIKNAFESNSNSQVLASGYYWNGGFDSAIKLDAAMRLSQAAGQPSATFYDVDNLAHVLAFADALVIVITVAGTYQYNLAKKQQLTVAIETATIDTLSSIVW